MIGTLLTAIVYIVSTVGVMGILAPATLGQSTAPYADAARALAGDRAAAFVALGAAISCFGALNGWVLIVGQIPLAVAQDGLFPPAVGRLSARGTPARAMIVAAVLSSGLIAMNYSRGLVDLFTYIILLATLSTLVPYTFCSLAGFILRRRTPALRWSTGARSRRKPRVCVFTLCDRGRRRIRRLFWIPAAHVRPAGLCLGGGGQVLNLDVR